VSIDTLLEGEDVSWLANFTDNNLEWFSQFGVRFSPGHYEHMKYQSKELPKIIKDLEKKVKSAGDEGKERLQKELDDKRKQLVFIEQNLKKFNPNTFNKLSEREKELHQRAFAINNEDPDYHQTEIFEYDEEGETRATKIPKGDILYGFRKDVNTGNLPTVSWLVAPQKFSDHPSAPWYGAWYVSEVLEILTKNPEVWKKTIFILNYDENDGYFDHIPPFVPPKPGDESTGKMSADLDATGEYVTLQQEQSHPGMKPENARESAVGLGYRVPLIVASPWSRGGWVNSEVCDITSTIMLMEKFLSHKTGKEIKETNISSWRRNICGDLTSVFRPYNGEPLEKPEAVDLKEHVKTIYSAGFKDLPNNFKPLNDQETQQVNADPGSSPWMPKQEAGTKLACSLPYELYVDGNVRASRKFGMDFRVAKEIDQQQPNNGVAHYQVCLLSPDAPFTDRFGNQDVTLGFLPDCGPPAPLGPPCVQSKTKSQGGNVLIVVEFGGTNRIFK
jgi:phospholipase C